MESLTPEALRVLGCLIEKEATTPDQYPLTMNSLLLACNQTSNRHPLVAYDTEIVDSALGELREHHLARVVHSPSHRAEKYRHVAGEAWGLTAGELAVLGVLALRGPQTVNDLRTRTERYGSLDDLGGADGVLHRLKNRYDEPYVTRLPRQPGQREERWAHLLGGDLDVEALAAMPEASSARPTTSDRMVALEQKVDALNAEVGRLAGELAELRRLFD